MVKNCNSLGEIKFSYSSFRSGPCVPGTAINEKSAGHGPTVLKNGAYNATSIIGIIMGVRLHSILTPNNFVLPRVLIM